MYYSDRKQMMKNLFLGLVQYVAFKFYYVLNRVGIFKFDVFDQAFIKLYFIYKRNIESDNLDFLKSFIKKNITVIDVGANIGYFSIEISKYLDSSSKIIAIEPSPVNFLRMQKVVKKKRPEPSTILVLAGLSEENGWGSLEIDPSNPANHKLTEEVDAAKLVELQTLDGITENLENVALIKIDVQGHELAVLMGGKRLLREQSPALLIEIDNRTNTNLGEKIWDYLDDINYCMFRTNDLEKEISKIQLKATSGYFDVFCIRKGGVV
jgi:FkbM family methyltransferase